MTNEMGRLFDRLPASEWVCWDRPPVMYVCYNSDGCSYYPMDTGIEARGPFPLFSWEYAIAPDGRGGFYVTGGHDENRQVRVQDPYSVGHKPPFPDSFFGPMISELWHYDVRRNSWTEVNQAAWGPRQCVGARHITYVPEHDCLVRTGACREGHSPRPPVPLRGWGIMGFWKYDLSTRRWAWMAPCDSIGPLTFDTRRRVVLGYKAGRVGVYDVHSNTAFVRPAPSRAPEGEGAFAYDAAHDLCLFHGENGETWSYDIDTNTWTNRRPKRSPTPRPGFGFALDPETGTALLFGGRGKPAYFDDSWLYSVERNEWTRIRCPMNPEGRFWWGRGIVFDEVNRAFVLYGGLALYHRVKARYATGDVWVFKLPPVKRPPGASRRPAAPLASIECLKNAVRVIWKPVSGAAGYVIERGVGEPGAVRFSRLPHALIMGTSWLDGEPLRGVRSEYRIAGILKSGEPGPWSRPVRTDPAVPTGLVVSTRGDGKVELTWDRSPLSDVVLYRVRRRKVVGDDQFGGARIIRAGRAARWIDRPAGLLKVHYQYEAAAVNRLGVSSGWSAPAGTIPSAPAHLKIIPNARNRSVTLRWPANPEQGIAGYNLYRWVEPPLRFAFKAEPELLTPAWWTFDRRVNPAERMQWVKVNDEPIRGTTFVDKGLRLVNTWYYIRAVNALDVEGHYRTSYSMPVWRWYTPARQFY